MNSQDKDFIDNFFTFLEPYHTSGVRFLAVIVCYLLLFCLGSFLSPIIIKQCLAVLPFSIEILQISPLEVFFNYLKIGFFFSLFATLPIFVYQFGKLKIEKDVFEQRINLLYVSLIVALIILISAFLTYKFFFPWQIIFLYGINLDVAYFSSSLTSMVAQFIFTLLICVMTLSLPLLRNLIKKSLLFNYATLIKNRKSVMIYCGILALLIVSPLELFAIGLIFLILFFWYKILVNFARKRD